MDLTTTWIGLACLSVFAIAYAVVMLEEVLHLRKSVPVIVAAGIIWCLVAAAYGSAGRSAHAAAAVEHNLLEYGELFLFLLAAITYVNTMTERQVFEVLRVWLVGRGWSLRRLFWVTGGLAFVLSPLADNLTTALVMGAVVVAVAEGNARFTTLACINVVVAANAGGAFSPFGDITTLMVWQKGVVPFGAFFALAIPALVNWLVPAVIFSLVLGPGKPASACSTAALRPGARAVIALFVCTIVLTVAAHSALHLPPVLGMMTGLGALKLYAYFLNRKVSGSTADDEHHVLATDMDRDPRHPAPINVFAAMERVEWDTLMFFYGVILSVGGLAALGYLSALSNAAYSGLGHTTANVLVGLLSAVVDNIPVMYAVLTMEPSMSQPQWLLATLTAGVGGSLLSIGSAAGVALMGQARGIYTFRSHLKWSWAVGLGYAASIGAHLVLNGR